MTDCIERTLELPVDLDTLWRTVTDPAGLESWLVDEIVWDLVPGGDARFVVDGEIRDGWVEEVCAPQDGEARVSFWWQAGDQTASRVCLELSEIEAGTQLYVCEARPLERLDVVGIPIDGAGDGRHGPAMIAA